MTRCFVYMLAMLAGLAIPAASFAQSKEAKLPDRLMADIAKIAPGAVVVSAEDIDREECESVGPSPGIVAADFNGDGRQDFAMLLKTRVSKKETVWQGKTLREAKFDVILFLDSGNDPYKAVPVYRYDGFVPTVGLIYLQSGVVRNRETGKTTRLRNAAFTLAFCGKSATTYYWAKNKLRSIPVAD